MPARMAGHHRAVALPELNLAIRALFAAYVLGSSFARLASYEPSPVVWPFYILWSVSLLVVAFARRGRLRWLMPLGLVIVLADRLTTAV